MANLKYVKDGQSHELPARGAVSSVNGKTGVVNLDSSDINVDNTVENPVPILNELSSLKENKVDKQQDVADAGKTLMINFSGNVVPSDLPKEIFWVTQNETLFADIMDAINQGLRVLLRSSSGRSMPIKSYNANEIWFADEVLGQDGHYLTSGRRVVNKNNIWDGNADNLLGSGFLATTINSSSANNTVPTSKTVYDYCLRDWVGTQAEYDAIAIKDAHTRYNIVEAST